MRGAEVKGPFRAAVVAAWVVAFGLYFVGGLRLLDTILVTLMMVLLPGLAWAQASMLEHLPFDRLQAYWSSILTLWVLGATSYLVGTRDGGLEAVGLRALAPTELIVWSLGLTAAGVGVMLVFRGVGRVLRVPETPVLRELLPRTPRERRVFAFLSLAAGIGEEIAFRGYALPVLAVALGLPGSVVVTSLVFGALHAYQGPLGMVRTSVMGAVLAGGMLVSGSVIPVMVAHTLVDLLGGLVISDWFVENSCRNNVSVR